MICCGWVHLGITSLAKIVRQPWTASVRAAKNPRCRTPGADRALTTETPADVGNLLENTLQKPSTSPSKCWGALFRWVTAGGCQLLSNVRCRHGRLDVDTGRSMFLQSNNVTAVGGAETVSAHALAQRTCSDIAQVSCDDQRRKGKGASACPQTPKPDSHKAARSLQRGVIGFVMHLAV